MAEGRLAVKTAMVMEGLEELREMLTGIAPREVTNILRNSVYGIATAVRDGMKTRVKKKTHSVEKGIYALRRRGGPNFPVSEVRIRQTDHGLMLEFGTSKTKAQPYIVPTVEGMRPTMADKYRETFGKKWEQSLARQAKKTTKQPL